MEGISWPAGAKDRVEALADTLIVTNLADWWVLPAAAGTAEPAGTADRAERHRRIPVGEVDRWAAARSSFR